MSLAKKKIRDEFKLSVLMRDEGLCKICGKQAVDAHHITNRYLMPNGGYAKENGISLCELCHIAAERSHKGFESDKLYKMIDSNKELAIKSSTLLKNMI